MVAMNCAILTVVSHAYSAFAMGLDHSLNEDLGQQVGLSVDRLTQL